MGAQQSLESSVSPRNFILWTIGVEISFIIIFGKRRYRLLVKIMALRFLGATEKKGGGG